MEDSEPGPPEEEAGCDIVIPSSLLIQKPLEDVLGEICNRLRGQQRSIAELQGELARERAARKLLQDRVDFVVKCTEDGQKALTDEVLHKFEQKLSEFTAAAEAKQQGVLVRVTSLEEKLGGAENLGSHMEAVQEIANILGMSIPQPGAARSAPTSRLATARGWASTQQPEQQQELQYRPVSGGMLPQSRCASVAPAADLGAIEEEAFRISTARGDGAGSGRSSSASESGPSAGTSAAQPVDGLSPTHSQSEQLASVAQQQAEHRPSTHAAPRRSSIAGKAGPSASRRGSTVVRFSEPGAALAAGRSGEAASSNGAAIAPAASRKASLAEASTGVGDAASAATTHSHRASLVVGDASALSARPITAIVEAAASFVNAAAELPPMRPLTAAVEAATAFVDAAASLPPAHQLTVTLEAAAGSGDATAAQQATRPLTAAVGEAVLADNADSEPETAQAPVAAAEPAVAIGDGDGAAVVQAARPVTAAAGAAAALQNAAAAPPAPACPRTATLEAHETFGNTAAGQPVFRPLTAAVEAASAFVGAAASMPTTRPLTAAVEAATAFVEAAAVPAIRPLTAVASEAVAQGALGGAPAASTPATARAWQAAGVAAYVASLEEGAISRPTTAPYFSQPDSATVTRPSTGTASSWHEDNATGMLVSALFGSGGQGARGSMPGEAGDADVPSLGALLRPKSGAARKVADVVDMLRRRPSVMQNGLLWKLQASLHEAVLEQERLKGEVESLRSQLEACEQGAETAMVLGERMDAVEDKVEQVQAMIAVVNNQEIAPTISFADLKVLEDKVNMMGNQVVDSAGRIAIIEEQLNSREASETAVSLVAPDQDTLAVLESHLLSQQAKLQKYMDSLASNIQNSVPGQVSSAVNATVMDISRNLERRLADRLASKQELQALSIRISSKITREEVERMLRTLQKGLPQAHAPASGSRMKCISCDSDLSPVLFGAAGGGTTAIADLRYSQLPSVSPPRQPGVVPQPARPASPPSVLPSAQASATSLSRVGSAAPSRHRTGLGAPISWLHQMRRDNNSSVNQGTPGSSRQTAEVHEGGWEGGPEGEGSYPEGLPRSPLAPGMQQDGAPDGEGSSGGPAFSSSRRPSGFQLGLPDAQARPFTRDGILERRRGTASVDGSIQLEVSASLSSTSRGPKVALPALQTVQQGGQSLATQRIRALHPPGSAGGSRSREIPGSPPPPATEASLTVQPVVPSARSIKSARPRTAAPAGQQQTEPGAGAGQEQQAGVAAAAGVESGDAVVVAEVVGEEAAGDVITTPAAVP